MTDPIRLSEGPLIAEQLRRAYEGMAWHGPDLQAVLSGVSAGRAAARVNLDAHSIQEIVLHLAAWFRIARERISAVDPVDPTPQEDWPAGAGSWSDALAELDSQYRRLQDALAAFPEARWHEAAPAAEPQTYYILMHGIVQHVCYHAGQIALLKK